MGCKPSLEPSDEAQPVNDERLRRRMGVGEGKLNDWFFDDHDVVEVVL